MGRHKKFVKKCFSKLELFLCLEINFLWKFNNQDTKNNTRNERIIDIDDEDVDDNVLIPFLSFCIEVITKTEFKEERDSRNLNNIFVNNNNVSSSLSVSISSRNDSSTITADHQRTGVYQKVPCPICE